MVMSKARNLLMGAMIYAEGTQLEDKTYRYRLQRCEENGDCYRHKEDTSIVG